MFVTRLCVAPFFLPALHSAVSTIVVNKQTCPCHCYNNNKAMGKNSGKFCFIVIYFRFRAWTRRPVPVIYVSFNIFRFVALFDKNFDSWVNWWPHLTRWGCQTTLWSTNFLNYILLFFNTFRWWYAHFVYNAFDHSISPANIIFKWFPFSLVELTNERWFSI